MLFILLLDRCRAFLRQQTGYHRDIIRQIRIRDLPVDHTRPADQVRLNPLIDLVNTFIDVSKCIRRNTCHEHIPDLRLQLLCFHKLDSIADAARDLYPIARRIDLAKKAVRCRIGIVAVNIQNIRHATALHDLDNTGIVHDLRHTAPQSDIVRLIDGHALHLEPQCMCDIVDVVQRFALDHRRKNMLIFSALILVVFLFENSIDRRTAVDRLLSVFHIVELARNITHQFFWLHDRQFNHFCNKHRGCQNQIDTVRRQMVLPEKLLQRFCVRLDIHDFAVSDHRLCKVMDIQLLCRQLSSADCSLQCDDPITGQIQCNHLLPPSNWMNPICCRMNCRSAS